MQLIKSIKDIKNLQGRVVLLRTDYNVQVKRAKILDTERIKRTFITIDFLLSHGAKVVIISHLGRPQGRRVLKYSLRPIAKFLKKKYPQTKFHSDCLGAPLEKKIAKMKDGDILLCENLRFYKMETTNDQIFAKKLASLGDIYVNDAFGVSHRKHASIFEITKYIDAYAGLNLLQELENINKVLDNFTKPAIAIIGGVKISTKIKVIEKFLKKFEKVLIGGALANNFLINLGLNVGESYYEKNYLKISKSFLNKFKERIVLPDDFIISSSFKKAKKIQQVRADELKNIKGKFYIVDIGPETIRRFSSEILSAQTLIWNGPLGLFEVKEFARGTYEIAKLFANHVKNKPFGLVGGGETVAVINNLGLNKKIDFISTGGGAMLEYIEKGTLPGIEVLRK